MSGPWEDFLPGPWGEFAGSGKKTVPSPRKAPGRMVGRSGTVNDPYDFSDGSSRRGLRRGAFYIDPDGNIRRNDNGDSGNPIIVPADQRTQPAPKKGFWEQRADDAFGPAAAALKGLAATAPRKPTADERARYKARVAKDGALEVLRQDIVGGLPRSPGEAVDQLWAQTAENFRTAGNLGGLLLSPVTGAMDVGMRPVARGMERAGIGVESENMGMLNTALMGLKPTPAAIPRPRPAVPPPARAVPEIKPFRRQDPVAMRARAEEFRAAGIQPAMVDVVDDAGRGVVRATAARPTPARQAVTDFRDARALNLPDRIGVQARKTVSNDPRSPVQIADQIKARRTAEGDIAFGAVRDERVPLTADAVAALRSPDGREAIRQAARDALNSLDPAERNMANELNRLADELLDQPGRVQITVGTAQAVSKALLDNAEAASRVGRNRTAQLSGELGRAVRTNAREAVPGYDAALNAYAADSRLLDATEVGKQFLRGNADEFGKAVGGMSPEEQALMRATARREIEMAAGRDVAAAPSVARRIATAPEQIARNLAALGPDDAALLQRNVGLEERLVRNANDIAPRSGSQTQLRQQDADTMASAIGVVQKFARGDIIGLAVDRLKTVGIRDDLAQAITEMAIDPARTDDALAALERLLGPSRAQIIWQEITSPEALVGYFYGNQPVREKYQNAAPMK